jgi:hypothetical protein
MKLAHSKMAVVIKQQISGGRTNLVLGLDGRCAKVRGRDALRVCDKLQRGLVRRRLLFEHVNGRAAAQPRL